MPKVQVENPVWNNLHRVRFKDAEFYVAEGRAEWVGEDQTMIRMVTSHPKNIAAAGRATEQRAAKNRPPEDWESEIAGRIYKPWARRAKKGLAALDHRKATWHSKQPTIHRRSEGSRFDREVTFGALISSTIVEKWPFPSA